MIAVYLAQSKVLNSNSLHILTYMMCDCIKQTSFSCCNWKQSTPSARPYTFCFPNHFLHRCERICFIWPPPLQCQCGLFFFFTSTALFFVLLLMSSNFSLLLLVFGQQVIPNSAPQPKPFSSCCWILCHWTSWTTHLIFPEPYLQEYRLHYPKIWFSFSFFLHSLTLKDGLRKLMTSFYTESQRYVTVERKGIFYLSINNLKHNFLSISKILFYWYFV